MPWPKALTEEQERTLIDEYRDYSVAELSVIYRVSHRTVYRTLAKYGVTLHGMGYKNRKKAKKKRRRPKKKRELQPCGTVAAYRRHLYRKEYPCTACLEANAAVVKRDRQAKLDAEKNLAPCGTPAAYKRHRKRGEPACRPCKDAAAARVRAMRQKKKEEADATG